jgi:glyoxylase-like metal-dependent hydrolase (beta-lactamase superfamily II)
MSPYKVYILQYAHRKLTSSEVFLGDTHQTPMEMAYFVWALKNDEHTVVVDMGFTAATAAARKRTMLWEIGAQLDKVKIDVAQVKHVIVTHMHYDHVGEYALFPRATYYLRDEEMAFWTGRHATARPFRRSVEAEDVVALVRLNYAGRIKFTAAREEIVPGVTVHRVGGHTPGMQIVEVKTAGGTAVLASDASHYYRNMNEGNPFIALNNIPEMLDGYDTIRRLASSPRLILPGHDPEVLKLYPQLHEGVCVME